MNRQQKYPDTPYFHYVNVNPRNRFGGDCVVRAISDALSQPWETTVRELTEMGIPRGLLLNDDHLYPLYLKSKGFAQCSEPRKFDNTRMTGDEFVHLLEPHDIIVANIGSHHVTCIKDRRIRDIWDCSRRPIHKYWIKK